MARTSLWLISLDDFLNVLSQANHPDDYETLINLWSYCWPDYDAPIPASTTLLLSCTPYTGDVRLTMNSTSLATTSAQALPAPLEPATLATCNSYSEVLDGSRWRLDFQHHRSIPLSILQKDLPSSSLSLVFPKLPCHPVGGLFIVDLELQAAHLLR